MEYKCLEKKCNEVYSPHRFLAMRHPIAIKCPKCGSSKKKRTELGTKIFKDIHLSINQARKD